MTDNALNDEFAPDDLESDEPIDAGDELIDSDGARIDDDDAEEETPRPPRLLSEEADALARLCAEKMIEKKARDVVMMDISKLTDVSDYFIVCSADSDTHLKAIADAVVDGALQEGIKPYRTEGWQGRTWIIIDFVEVVAHIFYHETREFYKIERLWGDAVVTKIEDEAAPTNTPQH